MNVSDGSQVLGSRGYTVDPDYAFTVSQDFADAAVAAPASGVEKTELTENGALKEGCFEKRGADKAPLRHTIDLGSEGESGAFWRPSTRKMSGWTHEVSSSIISPMKTKNLVAVLSSFVSAHVFAVSPVLDSVVRLVDNARVRFHTVVAADAPAPVRRGAAELAKYLDGGVPESGEKTLPVTIRVEELPELVKDGFVLDVKPDGIVITGWNARGALYGCYEILKKHAGMRWLVPGLNGDYRVGDWKNVSVPVGRRVCKVGLDLINYGSKDHV